MANIKMYTTIWCSECRQAKRLLNESGIAYEEINIEEHDGGGAARDATQRRQTQSPDF